MFIEFKTVKYRFMLKGKNNPFPLFRYEIHNLLIESALIITSRTNTTSEN